MTQESIQELNKYLETGALKGYCSENSLSYRKVLKTLRNSGYSYNKKTKQYQLQEDEETTTVKPLTSEEIVRLRALLNTYAQERPRKRLKVDTSKLTGNVKLKAYKVDEQAIEIWEAFCKEHKEYKIQDLISLALIEFANKYK